MNFKERNKAIVLIAKTGNTTLAAGNNINAEKSGLNDGEPFVINTAGTILTANNSATLAENFKIGVALSDGNIRLSDTINAKSVKKVTVQRYVAGANQVDYIGYNGTTGSISVIDNNVYKVNIQMRGTTAEDFSRMTIKHGVYKSDAAATQSEIAAGLTNSLITNFSREGSKLYNNTDVIKFERINSGAQLNAMAAGSAATATVVNGSKYVTLSSDQSTTCPAGSIIRLGTSGAGTAPCYIVSAISASGLVVTLDIPYQGVSETVAAANVETVTEGNWGIKLTGSELPYKVRLLNYARSSWVMGLQDFGSTTITNSTVMSMGSGAGKWVNEFESWSSLGYGRQNLNVPGVEYPTLYSSTSGTYATIHIQYIDDYSTELGHHSDALKELYIFCTIGTGTSYTSATVGLGDYIDGYASKYGWDLSLGTDTVDTAYTSTEKVLESSTA